MRLDASRRAAFGALVAALAALAAAAGAQQPGFTDATFQVQAPAPAGYDRAAAQRSTEAHLRALIGLDTQNPPGNEMRTARYFDSVFTAVPGLETRVLDEGANRANFIARLRAPRATKRPVIVMGHMDVVGVDTTKWSTRPFTATVKDGYLYGRGAIDDKGMLAAAATALALLAQRREQLDRDIIFVATAAEEGGDVGIDRIVERHRALIDGAEFALNEGGRIRVKGGRVSTVNVQVTEKVSYNVVATARGPSGHASVPLPANALAALARAVGRVHEWRAPVKLNATTRLYFARLAEVEEDPAMQRAMRSISRPGATPAAVRAAAQVLSREPLHNAVLRTGQSLTLMSGGIRTNVIPSDGTANFNVRALPDDDITRVVAEMNRVGAEPGVTFALRGTPHESPPVSPVTTDLYRSMDAAAKTMAPSAVVIPFMSTGGTDGSLLRAIGIPTYGILPMPLPMEDELRMHGDDERVPLLALGWATEYLYRVLQSVSERSGR